MFNLLTRLGIDVSGYDRWEIFWAGASSWIVWTLAIIALAATVLWTRSSVRELQSRPRRIFLALWQTLTIILILIVLFQPSVRLAKVAKIKDRVAVLIDSSASMSLPAGKKGEARAVTASQFMGRNEKFFDKLERDFVVDYQSFDAEAHELTSRPTAALTSQGEGTDLVSALSTVSAGGAHLAGVVLLSDGADTSRLGQRHRAGANASEVGLLLDDFPAPVNTVAVGEAGVVRDLAIVRVEHDDYGFVHNPFSVEVEIRSEGGLATQVPVVFKQGGQLLASKTIDLAPGQDRATATLSFTPRQVGEFMFSVELPAVTGEVTVANNLSRFPLKILRDKVRILYIVGNPSWDVRFLRQVLKKNPSVDLVSFYILRQHWDNYQARQSEVSLIEFPTHKLFTEELDTFDMLIWQNFRGPQYMAANYPKYMKNLNRFVRERGGAFLMIGGQRGFFGQSRLDPKLLDLLPVEPGVEVPNYVESDFRVEVTEAGLRHPIMDVGEGGDDLLDLWTRLPLLGGYNRTRRAKRDALVLATHPRDQGAEGKLPLVAVRETGAGRVMSVMTDCSWQWNLPAAGEGGSNKPYQRFWENSLRWLLRDPGLRLITVSADRGRAAPGEPVTIYVEVLDETYNPTDLAALKVQMIEQPMGSTVELPTPERYGAGKYRLTVTPEAVGGYRLRAEASLGGRSLGYDEALFEATRSSVEWVDVLPRPELMGAIGETTNGVSVTAADDAGDFVFERSEQEQIIGVRDLPLWDNWWVFTGCFGMMVAGWYFRRRWGLR